MGPDARKLLLSEKLNPDGSLVAAVKRSDAAPSLEGIVLIESSKPTEETVEDY